MEPEKKELVIPSYLLNTYQFQLKTKVKQVNPKGQILFEDTIFHPQGGGQPQDKGYIEINNPENEAEKIKIQIVSGSIQKQTGRIWNKLNEPNKNISIGDQVVIKIDQETRRKHAKLHSAGHLIDLAVQRLNYPWQTTKGYHFADGPYVQYKGVIENNEKMTAQINNQLKEIVSSNIKTVKQHYSYEEAVQKELIPKQFKTPLIRIIKFGENSCPCGGTHIEGVKDVQKLQIVKLQKKSKNVRVFYNVI